MALRCWSHPRDWTLCPCWSWVGYLHHSAMPPLLCGCNFSGCEAGQWTVSFNFLFFALIWSTTRPRALVPLVEFMYLVFTRMPGEAESYCRRLRSFCGVCVTSFECWLTFLFQCVKELLSKCTVLKIHLLYMRRESVVCALFSPRSFTGCGQWRG